MPDKHEVGGSSPLGPTKEVKERAEVQSRTERPRAFVERAEYPKGTKTVKFKRLKVLRES